MTSPPLIPGGTRFDLKALGAVLAVLAGAFIGERLGGGEGAGAFWMAAVASLAAWLWHGSARHCLILVVLGLLAAVSMQRALNGIERPPLASLAEDYVPVRVTGVLISDPRPGQYITRAVMRVAFVEPLDPALALMDAGRMLVVASGAAASRLRLLTAGESVTLKGRLGDLEGDDLRWRWQHAVVRLDAVDLVHLAPTNDPLLSLANPLRNAVLHGANTLEPKEQAIVRGFLVGDVREMDYETVKAFRAAGLSHLLAVSGANVAFVLSLAGPVLRRFGFRGRFIGGLTVIVVFGAMTRWEPSVLRAVTMAGMSQLAVYAGRPVDGQRALALTVIVLVLVDPFLVHSVGFVLSCAASAAILLLAPRIARRVPGPRLLVEPIAVTTAAQIGVAPVILPVFGTMPLVAIPANVLVAPVIGVLTTWGLCTGPAISVLRWIAPGPATAIAGLLQLPTRLLASYVMGVATVAAGVPFNIDARSAVGLLVLSCAVAVTLRIRCREKACLRQQPLPRNKLWFT